MMILKVSKKQISSDRTFFEIHSYVKGMNFLKMKLQH